MNKFIYNDHEILFLNSKSSILDCLEEAGHYVPSDCRSGRCNFCLLKVISGKVSSSSQYGLAQSQLDRGLFKSCVAKVNNTIICNDQIYEK